LNDFQRNAIDSMVTQLSDLKAFAVNYKDMSLTELEMADTEFNQKGKGQGNTRKLSDSVWRLMKKSFYNARVTNLRYSPISTVLHDLDLHDPTIKKDMGKEVPEIEGLDVKYSAYQRMMQLGVWKEDMHYDSFLPIPEEAWAATLAYHRADKDIHPDDVKK